MSMSVRKRRALSCSGARDRHVSRRYCLFRILGAFSEFFLRWLSSLECWLGPPRYDLSVCMALRTRALHVVAGELERWGSATFVWGTGPRVPTSMCGPILVGDGNYSCQRVVGGGDFSCEQVVQGGAETCRARRLLVGDGVSCRWRS
jgi:hypothetical protein